MTIQGEKENKEYVTLVLIFVFGMHFIEQNCKIFSGKICQKSQVDFQIFLWLSLFTSFYTTVYYLTCPILLLSASQNFNSFNARGSRQVWSCLQPFHAYNPSLEEGKSTANK